jgi:hypothetical protein
MAEGLLIITVSHQLLKANKVTMVTKEGVEEEAVILLLSFKVVVEADTEAVVRMDWQWVCLYLL